MSKDHVHFPLVMGILNVTPDSFYDGGKYTAIDTAVQQAVRMIEEGADIIDIGGESTGPGSEEVSSEEELRRAIPVIERMRKCENAKISGENLRICEFAHFRISIDTYKAEVARQVLRAGATMVNDVTTGRGDSAMFPLIAETGCFYVMMRSKDDSPRTTRRDAQYEDVMRTIHAFFEERIAAALARGIRKEQLILDPGLGHFVSSDPKYSWEILERLEELSDFGCPILVSPSRKSFTAGTKNLPPSERLEETLRATNIALVHGASIIRTHDVVATKKTIADFLETRSKH